MYDPWSTSRPPEEKHPMVVIVFNATGHVDCAFVFAAYKMRSDVTIAARSVVDIADKVMESRRRSGMTLLNWDVVVYQVGHTCDRPRHRRRKCVATMVFRSFPKDCRCCMRQSSQMIAIFADGD